jgi:hypothetical protein
MVLNIHDGLVQFLLNLFGSESFFLGIGHHVLLFAQPLHSEGLLDLFDLVALALV